MLTTSAAAEPTVTEAEPFDKGHVVGDVGCGNSSYSGGHVGVGDSRGSGNGFFFVVVVVIDHVGGSEFFLSF